MHPRAELRIAVRRCKRLSNAAKVVFACIEDYRDGCWASTRALGEQTAMGHSRTHDALTELMRIGVLTRSKSAKNRSIFHYKVNYLWIAPSENP